MPSGIYIRTPEQRARIAEVGRKSALTPEWRKKQAEAMHKRSFNPEWRKNNANAMRKRALNPEWSKKNAERMRMLALTPEWKKHFAEGRHKMVLNPEWRKNNADAMRKIHELSQSLTTYHQNGLRQIKQLQERGLVRVFTTGDRIQGGRTAIRLLRESGHAHTLTPEDCLRGGQLQGPIQGRKNVESGHLASLRTPAHQRIAGRLGGEKSIAAHRRRLGPNAEEAKLHAELERLGLRFEPEVNLGHNMGVPDVLVCDIVGELDAGGHWANYNRKHGVSDAENLRRALEKDARHDALRRKHGFIVIRDSNPIRLARRIAAVDVAASYDGRNRPYIRRPPRPRRNCPGLRVRR